MSQIYDDLLRIHELLSDPARWAKFTLHDTAGSKGDRWCLVGAAQHAVSTTDDDPGNVVEAFFAKTLEERLLETDTTQPRDQSQRLNEVLKAIARELPASDRQPRAAIPVYNNAAATTHKDIINILDAAIISQLPAIAAGNPRASIPRYNDAPQRTHADVMRMLDAAIERYRNEDDQAAAKAIQAVEAPRPMTAIQILRRQA